MSGAYYLIQPKDEFVQWVREHIKDSFTEYLLTESKLWSTYQPFGLYELPELAQEDEQARVKLLFLAELSSWHGVDDANALEAEAWTRLLELLGESGWTLDTFDHWWALEKFDGWAVFEEVLEEVGVRDLERVGPTGIDMHDDWLANQIAAKKRHVDHHLPELMDFVRRLEKQCGKGEVRIGPEMNQRVAEFFTPEMMESVEAVIPGWKEMAGYNDGETLVHVVTALVALWQCPEYQKADDEDQTLMKWIVLLHDLAKAPVPGQREGTHGFRSAALAARILPTVGFDVTDDYAGHIDDWFALTTNATTTHPKTGETIQDNGKLPQIVSGIETLFGEYTSATRIIQTILLHMSIDVVADWPQKAPLSDSEIRQYIDSRLLRLLQVMMLVDNDAWAFFDPATKLRYRNETLAVFQRLRRICCR